MTESNHLYQFSNINALMAGACEDGIPVSKLLTKGNQALGTFSNMDGELVMLDGAVYYFKSDGSVEECNASTTEILIPFTQATSFEPQYVMKGVQLKTKHSVDEVVSLAFPKARNQFLSYRLKGKFQSVHVRMCAGREYPGQPLSEVTARQVEYTYEDVQGTVVGLRSPVSWQGFTVAGHHMHFLSEDKMLGGHILGLKGEDVTVEVAVVSNVHMELPTGPEYNEADLTVDDEGIKRAEG
ncbi:hypothetical protein KEM55_007349 [Ascosphaera atra]|nr:hypothetical protein KEM55_007349 [Ascosphaera atra]